MQLTVRDRTISVLRTLGLNRILAKLSYSIQGFKPANADMLSAIDRALEEVQSKGIAGDYLEFGVFKGASLLYTQQSADQKRLTGMKFFGFDSFAGLPEEQDQRRKIFYRGQYMCSESQVRTWLSQYGADWERVVLVPGFYDRTLTDETKDKLKIKKCAVAMLDCDIYSSTKDALSWIDDLLQPGSVVILDDWDAYGDDDQAMLDGQKRAMSEHRKTSRWAFQNLFHYGAGLRGGQAFVVLPRSHAEQAGDLARTAAAPTS